MVTLIPPCRSEAEVQLIFFTLLVAGTDQWIDRIVFGAVEDTLRLGF